MNGREGSRWKDGMAELGRLSGLGGDNSMTSARSSCLLVMFSSCIVDFSHSNH